MAEVEEKVLDAQDIDKTEGSKDAQEPKKVSRKSREDRTSKKREDKEKNLDQVLKSLNNFSNPAEKFDGLCKKYNELLEESKRQQLTVKVTEKKLNVVLREKEQLVNEHTKSVLSRTRLETLCRELQRQNKAMKEESLLRIKEEEERRKEVSAKFHATLAEITTLMQQNSESNSKLRDENLQMQNQFKGVCEQYELREQQVEKISKQMKLEGQLADAKLAKAKLELQAQKDVLEREKAELMAQVAMCQAKILDHEKTEMSLRAQVNVYFEKYDEFQNVLTKSNQVYAGFKTEMEKMSKKITRLEKETTSWKQKWENTHKALLSLAAEKQVKDAEVALQARQLAQLQKLCRTMHAERSSLLAQLNASGVTPILKGDGSAANESLLENVINACTGNSPQIANGTSIINNPSKTKSSNGSVAPAEKSSQTSLSSKTESQLQLESSPLGTDHTPNSDEKKVSPESTVAAPESEKSPLVTSQSEHSGVTSELVNSVATLTSENTIGKDSGNLPMATSSSESTDSGNLIARPTSDKEIVASDSGKSVASPDEEKQSTVPSPSENPVPTPTLENTAAASDTGNSVVAPTSENALATNAADSGSAQPSVSVLALSDVPIDEKPKSVDLTPVHEDLTSKEKIDVDQSSQPASVGVENLPQTEVNQGSSKAEPQVNGSSPSNAVKKSESGHQATNTPPAEHKKGKEGGKRRKK